MPAGVSWHLLSHHLVHLRGHQLLPDVTQENMGYMALKAPAHSPLILSIPDLGKHLQYGII